MDTISARLDQLGVPHEPIPHSPCASGEDRALALRVGPDLVAATVILVAADGPVLAVVPCYREVDEEAAAEALHDPLTRIATSAEAAGAIPGWSPAAVPPLRSLVGVRVLVDPEVLDRTWVVIPAGIPDLSVRVRMADLVAAGEAEVAPVSAHPEFLRLAALD